MRKYLALGIILLLTLTAAVNAEDSNPKAKATFILELVNNIVWPASKNGVINIAVAGSSAVTSELIQVTTSNKRFRIKVTEISMSENLSGYDIVYTSTDDLKQLAKILKNVGNSKICTVSSAKNFARFGVMINIFNEEGKSKVKYEVNKMVIDGAGLKLKNNFMEKAIKI